MPLDLAAELAQALQDPRVGSALAQYIQPMVAKVLADREADAWLSAQQAARYVYGSDGKTEAFRKLRERHPQLDQISLGTGKLRRWKRADLDGFLQSNPRLRRERD